MVSVMSLILRAEEIGNLNSILAVVSATSGHQKSVEMAAPGVYYSRCVCSV